MNKAWLLTKVLVKNQYTGTKGKKIGKTLLFGFLLLVGFIPVAGLLWMFYQQYFDLRLPEAAFNMGFITLALTCVLMQLFTFPNVFYFSKDLDTLLSYPVKPMDIIIAKTAVASLGAMPFLLLFTIPLIGSALVSGQLTIAGCVIAVLECLMTGAFSLLVMAALAIIGMTFLPVFKNPDRFNLIMGIVSIILALTFSIGMQAVMQSQTSSVGIPAVQMMAISRSMAAAASLIPIIPFAVKACLEGSIVGFLLSLLVLAAAVLVYIFLAQKLYLKSALAANSGQTSAKKKQKMSFKTRKPFAALFSSEMHKLIRTPAYMTNMVMGSFLMPVILIAAVLFIPNMKLLKELLISMDIIGYMEGIGMAPWAVFMLLGMGVTFFVGTMAQISGTSISREGEAGVAWMKTIPVSMQTQMNAKLQTGNLFSLISSFLMLILFHMLLVYPWYLDIFYVIGCIPTAVLLNLISLCIDCAQPRLVWDSETAAIKNNFNGMIDLLISWALCAVLAVVVFLLLDHLTIAAVVICLLLTGLCALFWKMPAKIFWKFGQNRE